jgi:hypothetical protein
MYVCRLRISSTKNTQTDLLFELERLHLLLHLPPQPPLMPQLRMQGRVPYAGDARWRWNMAGASSMFLQLCGNRLFPAEHGRVLDGQMVVTPASLMPTNPISKRFPNLFSSYPSIHPSIHPSISLSPSPFLYTCTYLHSFHSFSNGVNNVQSKYKTGRLGRKRGTCTNSL